MLRTTVMVLACAWCATAVAMVAVDVHAWPMLLMAGLILAGTVFERARYRGDPTGPVPGPAPAWRETGERFRDEATGAPMAVWFDPASGARRYVAVGETPPA